MPNLISIYAVRDTVYATLAALDAPFDPLLKNEEEECGAADVVLRAPWGARLTIRIVYDIARARWEIPAGQFMARRGIYAEGTIGADDFLQLLVPAGTTFTIRSTLAAA